MHSKAHALVVLPAGTSMSRIAAPHRRWLERARVARDAPSELLLQTLRVLGVTPSQGLGALRWWGQTGTPPADWIAAADPVYLEARLDHLVLHPMAAANLHPGETGELFQYLQRVLGGPGGLQFTSIGTLGYVRRDRSMATAGASPALARGPSPEAFMPAGEPARAHDRLQSEVQMCLFESPVNQRRVAAGQWPVNALWIWGGGAASPSAAVLPPLYADDPLFKGYWLSASAEAADWPGDLRACFDASPAGFVAVLPELEPPHHDAAMNAHVADVRRLLRPGRLQAMTIVAGDGMRVHTSRWDALRLWRRHSPLFKEENTR
jgi:hypothetical protein